ncbi:MAG: MBL fold metallo-hydrolase [Candidatus Hodarchaeales archaeon]|jgi:7,8-dihydropterin-6-yl-methyl-4-(beta-D-ribofuranosyl)aminobenzene 5'-phosphate synthase
MEAKITNVYTNEAKKGGHLIGDHGQAFHIKIDNQNVLFDTGTKSDVLLHNMNILGLSPHVIDKIVFSHGHFDHTAGLPGLLDNVNPSSPIPVFGSPCMVEKKIFKLAFIKKDISFPSLSENQKSKIQLKLSKKPIELVRSLTTTGEISYRPYKDGREPNAYHLLTDGTMEVDPMVDDQSLILHTKEGLVIITGCCHAGLLNTLEHIQKLHKDNLEQKFNTPDLNLNHCTDNFPFPLGRKTQGTKILKNRFGDDKVKICTVGTSFIFQID